MDNHHSHKYMNEQGYAYSCCGSTHVYASRNGRDKALEHHNHLYEIEKQNEVATRKSRVRPVK